jgi:hypothetical protein
VPLAADGLVLSGSLLTVALVVSAGAGERR